MAAETTLITPGIEAGNEIIAAYQTLATARTNSSSAERSFAPLPQTESDFLGEVGRQYDIRDTSESDGEHLVAGVDLLTNEQLAKIVTGSMTTHFANARREREIGYIRQHKITAAYNLIVVLRKFQGLTVVVRSITDEFNPIAQRSIDDKRLILFRKHPKVISGYLWPLAYRHSDMGELQLRRTSRVAKAKSFLDIKVLNPETNEPLISLDVQGLSSTNTPS